MQLAEFWYAAGSTIWWTCAGLLVAVVTSVVGVWFFGVRWARRVGEENSTWIAERRPAWQSHPQFRLTQLGLTG